MMRARYQPRAGVRTTRAMLRRDIRNRLGTNGSPAPNTRVVLIVARMMGDLVRYSTNGALRLELRDRSTGEQVDWTDAIANASQSEIL